MTEKYDGEIGEILNIKKKIDKVNKPTTLCDPEDIACGGVKCGSDKCKEILKKYYLG